MSNDFGRVVPPSTTQIIFGTAYYTANLQEWRDSNGQVISYIDRNGNICVKGKIIDKKKVDFCNLGF